MIIVRKTIDDVVEESVAEYQINSSAESKKVYRAFLQDDAESRGWKYFLKSKKASKFSYLCAKLFLFSVMAKMTPVKENYVNKPVIIEDMNALASKGTVVECWQDERLYRAFEVLSFCSRSLRLPSYIETINELGKHPFVAKKWNGVVCYDGSYERRPNRNGNADFAVRGYTVGRLRSPFIRSYMRD